MLLGKQPLWHVCGACRGMRTSGCGCQWLCLAAAAVAVACGGAFVLRSKLARTTLCCCWLGEECLQHLWIRSNLLAACSCSTGPNIRSIGGCTCQEELQKAWGAAARHQGTKAGTWQVLDRQLCLVGNLVSLRTVTTRSFFETTPRHAVNVQGACHHAQHIPLLTESTATALLCAPLLRRLHAAGSIKGT